MKVFLLFLLAAFFGGILLLKSKPSHRNWYLFGLCFLLMVAFFFFHKL